MGIDVPDGSIVITPKEFYDGVREDIAAIKNAVAPLTPMVEDVNELKHQVNTLNDRLHAIEARIWRASGFAAAIGLAASWIIPQVIK